MFTRYVGAHGFRVGGVEYTAFCELSRKVIIVDGRLPADLQRVAVRRAIFAAREHLAAQSMRSGGGRIGQYLDQDD